MMARQNKQQKKQESNGNALAASVLLDLCRSFSILSGLAVSYRPTAADVERALTGLKELLSFHNVSLVGNSGEVVSFDPKIHYCNKEVKKRVRIVTPAFFLETAERKILLRRAFVQPAPETRLACFFFDVICEECFSGSYLYTGHNREMLDLVVATQAHLRIECPKCGYAAGSNFPYSPGPNYDLQSDALALVESDEVEPGATVLLKRKDGKIVGERDLFGPGGKGTLATPLHLTQLAR